MEAPDGNPFKLSNSLTTMDLNKGTLKNFSYEIYKYIIAFEDPVPIEVIFEKFEKYTDKHIQNALDNLYEIGYIYYPRVNYVRAV